MNHIKEIDNVTEIDRDILDSTNYKVLGMSHTAQLLVDQKANEYRRELDEELIEDDRNKIYLNGTREQTLNTPCGKITYDLPVFRQRGFENPLTGSWCRDSEDFELLVYMSFINGLSTRDIERMSEIMGCSCSRSKVSRISQKYNSQVELLQNRPLSDEDYCLLSVDATYPSILTNDPDNNHYEKKPVFRALGLNAKTGYWDILSIKVYESENKVSYTDFLFSLRERGLNNPVMFIQDFDSALSKAMKTVFPLSFKQGCLFHYLSNVVKNLPKNVGSSLLDPVLELVGESEVRLRKQELSELVLTYEEEYPDLIKSIKRNLEEAMTWSSFNSEFKTNNMNERANEEDKRLIKAKGGFKSIESAERIMMANSYWYMSNTKTKRQADFTKLREMLERYRIIIMSLSEDILDCFTDSLIPESPPKFSTPVLWFDTIDLPCEWFGLETTMKVLVCYGLKKAWRRRRFLWACPLLQADCNSYERVLEIVKEAQLKETEFIILPASNSLLIDSVESVFKESKIQIDLKDFNEVIAGLLPVDYREAFSRSFIGAFENDSLEGFTEDTIDLIEKSLSHHHLKEALLKFRRLKNYLLTFFKLGINYFFNIQPVKNLRAKISCQRSKNENFRSFLSKTLDKIRLSSWSIPCVYQDEVRMIFNSFNLA